VSAVAARRPYLILSVAIVAFDQVTKWMVQRGLELHDSREVVSGLVSLTHVRNRGAAFGFLSNADLPYQSILFSILSLAALGAIALYAFKLPLEHKAPQIALAMIMGGAVGNLVDRMAHGYVVDFVDVYWRAHHWPAFNVADSCISIGVALLILDLLRTPGPGSEEAVATGAASHGE
jgi:signal peptidase II